jgi:hypothetical protein
MLDAWLHELVRDRDDDPTLDSWEDDRAAREPQDFQTVSEYEVRDS